MSTPYPPPQPDEFGGMPKPVDPPYFDQPHVGAPSVGAPYAGQPDDYVYPPQPYGRPFAPVDQLAPGQPPTGVNGLAIAALIAAFLLPPVAIIFGHLALSQIESRNEGGRGLAVTGLVIGYLLTVLTVIGVIIAIVFLVVLANAFDDYRMRTAPEDRPTVSTSVAGTPINLVRNGFDHGDGGDWTGSVVRLAS